VLSVIDTARPGRFASGARAAFPRLEHIDSEAASLLELGLAAANVTIAGSEAVARELGSPELTGPLAAKVASEVRPVAVGTGLDYALFNPATDTALPSRFDAEDASNKGRCKAAVLNELELELELDRPLLFAQARSGREAQVLLDALPALLKHDIALVAAMPPSLSADLDRTARDYPADLARLKDNSEPARRRMLGAADFALGLDARGVSAAFVQAAQRYGAVPVALAAGAVSDAIVDCDAELETGTGFSFDTLDVEALLGAATRAVLPGTRVCDGA
jgi:starch synthase